MFIPNGFKSSEVSRRAQYDAEGRMREVSIARGSVGSVGDANSLFATEAEKFGSVAPFLKASMAKDAGRRNYIIQHGGAAIHFDGPAERGFERPMAEFPDSTVSFGHYSEV